MGMLIQSMNDFLGLGRTTPLHAGAHLDAAMGWLCRAQDATPDGGVSRMYHIKTGWGASYPETTGYIIPTFIEFAKFTGRQEFVGRALRMADWEIDVQMPSGAVQGGTIADPPSPAIFNTGQVIFGWIAAYMKTGDEKHKKAAIAAGNFLVDNQDPDGAWRRNLSAFCSPIPKPDSYCYNIRTAWALHMLAEVAGEVRFREAAESNLEHVLGRTASNGWTPDNCLNDPLRPLLHTIAYTTQGMLETAVRAGNQQAIDTVETANMHLARCFERYKQLHGRYDKDWKPAARWRCLTGEAQTAVVWFRLAQITGKRRWDDWAIALTEQIKRTQVLYGDPNIVGGIKGSQPIYGWYGKYQYLNWAAKFYADALMLEAGHRAAGTTG
jgi:hypothetical protein